MPTIPPHQHHSDDFMLDANHQQIWMIASPVAQPPPIRLTPLHLNTMGDIANVRFCQNHWWGRVIVGVLPMELKSVIFTHDTTINWAMVLPPLIHCVPLRSNTVGEALQLSFCRNRHRQHGGEGGGEGGGGGRGFVKLVGRWRRVYMMKRSCAEALPIFYWARQLMPARLMKWREEARVR